MNTLLKIDGSEGEGGGQIVRSSLALSAFTGTPVEISNIRAKRARPGLARQHLTSARAAARVCNGRIDGDELGSRCVSLYPGPVAGGHFEFRVGSAGSAMLVLQTVLPPLLTSDCASTVILEGGTHNPMAPPFEFLQKSFLPLLNCMGPTVTAELERAGFYPAGGGRVVVKIQPAEVMSGFELLEKGRKVSRRIVALVANLPGAIAQRELDTARRRLSWSEVECHQRTIESAGPGNVVWAELECENITQVFTAFGEKGVRAEQIVSGLTRSIRKWMRQEAPVGPYLADQLMLPLALSAHRNHPDAALAGGRFRTMKLTQHALTQREILQTFLSVVIDVGKADGMTEVCVRPKPDNE